MPCSPEPAGPSGSPDVWGIGPWRPFFVDGGTAGGWGSSAIPAFQTLLRSEVPSAELVLSDLFGSVTGGLAMQAYAAEIEKSKAKTKAKTKAKIFC